MLKTYITVIIQLFITYACVIFSTWWLIIIGCIVTYTVILRFKEIFSINTWTYDLYNQYWKIGFELQPYIITVLLFLIINKVLYWLIGSLDLALFLTILIICIFHNTVIGNIALNYKDMVDKNVIKIIFTKSKIVIISKIFQIGFLVISTINKITNSVFLPYVFNYIYDTIVISFVIDSLVSYIKKSKDKEEEYNKNSENYIMSIYRRGQNKNNERNFFE